MHSRVRLEALLRAVALGAMLLATAVAFAALWGRYGKVVPGRALPAMLREWSATRAPARIHVRLDSIPGARDLAWLSALGGTGSVVTWSATDSLLPSAFTNEPLPDPLGRILITAVGQSGEKVSLRDAAGAIDSFHLGPAGVARMMLPRATGSLRLEGARSASSSPTRDSLVLRNVVVLGKASWEAKFIAASLEEAGWNVVARFGLSPAEEVIQGPPAFGIDTGTVSTVIAVDTLAAGYATAIARFVRNGGGLVILPGASGATALHELLPADPAVDPVEGVTFGADSLEPEASLAFRPLMRVVKDATVLARRGGEVTMAVRRVGKGRVLQLGHVDTWRWRMAARGDSALGSYRQWWSRLVGMVAYAPRIERSGAVDTVMRDPAPLAGLVDRLGAPGNSVGLVGASLLDPRLLPWLFGLVVVALLLEWCSRRLRGRP